MSELLVKNPPNALIVSAVDSGSPSDRAGIQPGDWLRAINGKPVLDILDYQFHSAESRLRVDLERDGHRFVASMRVSDGDTPGLAFESDLGDKIHTCNNKCVFCFIHQMPKKMRKTLYLMDDDFRLSFIHGNYVTLTNLSDAEWSRILEQRLSPLYVSVHATEPVLRAMLIGKSAPQPILPRLRELAHNRIDVHAQIVLCPGLNDGEDLWRTLDDLAGEHPHETGLRAGVQSVAIVPVGLTRFRDRLPNLATATRDYALAMVSEMKRRSRGFRGRLGTRFAWLSDEWYFLADVPVPGAPSYEEFPQLEDGIGTVRLFLDRSRMLCRRLPRAAPTPISATLVTAELPADIIQDFAERLNQVEGVDLNVCVVKNEFFGGTINIAGLLTATDMIAQLRRFDARDVVCIPRICLRDDILTLDDYTVQDLRRETGRDVRVVGNEPKDLTDALGIAHPGRGTPDIPGPPQRAWVMEHG